MRALALSTGAVVGVVILAAIGYRIATHEPSHPSEYTEKQTGAAHETTGPASSLVKRGDPLRSEHASTTDDPQTLLAQWSKGKFERVARGKCHAKVSRHLALDIGTPLDEAQVNALYRKFTDFLLAYSTGQFDDYLRFRDPTCLVGDDDERVQNKLRALAKSWDSNRGPQPTTAVELLECVWNTYVDRDAPPINAVNWASCRGAVRELPKTHILGPEWKQNASIQSHLYKAFKVSRRASVSPIVLKTLVPNHVSVEEIADRDGRIVYADVEIVQRSSGRAAAPVILRFVWDGVGSWIPWNIMLLHYTPDRMIIW